MSGRCRGCRRAGLVLVALGGLWLCLWRGPWRRWGAVAIVAGLAGMATDPAARHRDRRYRPLSRGAGARRRLFRLRRARRAVRCLDSWPRRPASRNFHGRRRVRPTPRSSIAAVNCAATRRAGGGLRSSPALARCRSTAPDVDAIVGQVPAGFSLSPDDAGDRPHQFMAARRGGAVARRGRCRCRSANDSRGDRPWVPHPQSRRRHPDHPY